MSPVPGATWSVLAVLGRGLVPPDALVVRADDAGLTRGDGCFEGCRIVDGVVANLDAHVARMARSAAALEIEFDEPGWRGLVAEAAAAAPGGVEGAVKLVLTRGAPGHGATGHVAITSLTPEYSRLRAAGLRVITLDRGTAADAFDGAPWLLGGVKTLSYAINMAAVREALRQGADDVVFVSPDSTVLESPSASVVWASGDTLHTTPTGGTGILAGTTTRLIFERAPAAGWQTRLTLASVDDLHAADVVWLVSSVRGPIDVIQLNGRARERLPEVDAQIRRLAGF